MSDHSRNIEIKAEIRNKDEFERKIEIAKSICDGASEPITILNQRDVFFQVGFRELRTFLF